MPGFSGFGSYTNFKVSLVHFEFLEGIFEL